MYRYISEICVVLCSWDPCKLHGILRLRRHFRSLALRKLVHGTPVRADSRRVEIQYGPGPALDPVIGKNSCVTITTHRKATGVEISRRILRAEAL